MFRASWIPVAHVTLLDEPGRYVVAGVSGERVVVVRGADLELSAFIDGCIHRGTPLFEDDEGKLERLSITCPYHGLRYDLRGIAEARACPAFGLAPGARLRPVRAVERLGFVFVCLEPATPAFEEWAGPLPPWLSRAQMHALRLGRRVTNEVRANWKLVVQNFQESHHFTLVHPGLEARTPWQRSDSVDFGGAFIGGTMELRDGIDTVSEAPGLEGRPLVASPADARHVSDALLFPGWMTSLQPDYFLSYRIVPEAPAVTTVIADIYFHASAFGLGFDPSNVYRFWDRTNAEDRKICERQQRGLASPSFEMGPYAPVEDGVHAFDRRVAAAYLALSGAARTKKSER
ncbi:MAG: aromatic ring-hydroxylating dioxygenase subunit alpha [Polyangiaceae bacterium]|nr:aromatic ring-hydroxylating dioxygenase subunit alpha [Polyangiaceae bacterium]